MSLAPASCDVPAKPHQLLGVPLEPLSRAAALERIEHAIRTRSPLRIGMLNAAKAVQMQHDLELRAALLETDMILADGMGIVWAAGLLGRRVPERIAGIDLMHDILARAAQRGWRIFLLGATPDVLRETERRIVQRYPGAIIAGRQHGYYAPEQEPEVAERIAGSQADVLLIGMSSPRKELFIARHGGRLNVPVLHGVGGSFDVLAGKVRRAPQALQRAGLEWAYRVWQEPRRLWKRYLVTNTLFAGMVLRELLSGRGSAA